jgi:hypothetical protein
MSHITTVSTKISLKNEGMIKAALKTISGQFAGMTFEQTAPDVIKVRGYKPIEVYQTHGNIQFIKNPATGIWEMQLDPWNCKDEVQKVKDAFFVAYQQSAVTSYLSMNGYMTTTQKDGKNLVLTATKY